ncbi:MAG: hypothetical protein KatS3mg093_334 [Candidatus Parcubacteria bacterium]|nr:MAG: hypothetical protein KatS3mg001_297 [Candidatus Pacearchaeota archaeon]GIW65355.1 MAG: hypothetical protein KatS3mg093_334 [Candidatus Parcubacteria bacterium]
MNKIILSEKENIKKILKENKRIIFNFFNSHDLYFFSKYPLFRKVISFNSINFTDGSVISFYLSLKNLKKVRRFSGPDFIKDFFEKKEIVSKKRHFFVGFEEKDIEKLIKKFPYLDKKNLFCYNPAYIKKIKFSEKEINKIAKIINSKKTNIVWVGLGCPKQYFLTYDLFKKTKVKYFFNVGAGLDFLLGKKKRAPKIIRSLGIEWLYRLITDFKHSKKKVWRSFVSLQYLNKVQLKNK